MLENLVQVLTSLIQILSILVLIATFMIGVIIKFTDVEDMQVYIYTHIYTYGILSNHLILKF